MVGNKLWRGWRCYGRKGCPFLPRPFPFVPDRGGTRAASSTAAHSPFTSRVTPNLTLLQGKDVSSGIAGRRGTTVAVNLSGWCRRRSVSPTHPTTPLSGIDLTLLRNREDFTMKEDLIKGKNLSDRSFFVEPNS